MSSIIDGPRPELSPPCPFRPSPSAHGPCPGELQEAIQRYDNGEISAADLGKVQNTACRDSIEALAAGGQPVVSNGEQRASSFATYPLTDTLAGTTTATWRTSSRQVLPRDPRSPVARIADRPPPMPTRCVFLGGPARSHATAHVGMKVASN